VSTEDTRRIVESYFRAWTTQDIATAMAQLADDLEFSGPGATIKGAKEFEPSLVGFAHLTRSARILELLVDGDRAALLYDCELIQPAGTVRIASFFQVAGGKIRRYDTRFDPAALAKLQRGRQDTQPGP
jgi:ketosteroid isomerase-like protein